MHVDDLLAAVLHAPTPAALAVLADALTEAGHPYGEFLTLHLAGTRRSLELARALERRERRAWLGDLDAVFDSVEYAQGLPVAAHYIGAGVPSSEACAQPLLRAFRRVLLARTRGDPAASLDGYFTLLRAMAPFALTELDAGSGSVDLLPGFEGTKITHLHGLDVLAGVPFEARAWPSVESVDVFLAPGTSLRVMDALLRDPGGLFAARRPRLSLRTSRQPSEAERTSVRAALPRLRARTVLLNGQVL
jgi:hypothetical protein